MDATAAAQLGITLIFLGFMLLVLSMLIIARRSRGKARGGAVIFIGPVPIAVGSDRISVLIAVLMAVAMIAMLYLMLWGFRI